MFLIIASTSHVLSRCNEKHKLEINLIKTLTLQIRINYTKHRSNLLLYIFIILTVHLVTINSFVSTSNNFNKYTSFKFANFKFVRQL